MIRVSLLVCTRDRGASLDRTLASITRAAAGFNVLEVIVVDNGSSDDTPLRLATWRSRQAFPVTVVDEPQAGLARARNAGLSRARGDIVAMTDDDCVLDAGYFAMLVARFALNPAPVVIGGRILLGDPDDLPVTIKLEDHVMDAPHDSFPHGFVMGANLAFTRDVVDRIGRFDERFGAGARFRAAEDTDFVLRALDCQIPVRYDPYIVVSHHHGRRSADTLRRLLAGYAFGDGALYAKHLFGGSRIARAIWRDVCDAIAECGGGERPFASIRFFHAFRLGGVVKGFAKFALTARLKNQSGWRGR
ncbi:glycosyltransferase family 2 protein [Sphingomonas sp. Leaf343]|uniref:glycosyltransferase family 2 protein n=1 Tax=Sphingomonas sp. Leaf343 TaxID=1736345 RepID=UPI0006FB7A7B|nr:glycosyltransferase family A protein [Sphingomonas sp. Leaf343]KQR82159.1 glycosyl transferase [Sphingomonas sp. Leaf343]